MDRYWLMTWTTYGAGVAGDAEGFVSNVYAEDGGPEVRRNVPAPTATPTCPGLSALRPRPDARRSAPAQFRAGRRNPDPV